MRPRVETIKERRFCSQDRLFSHYNIVSVNRFSRNRSVTLFSFSFLLERTQKQRFLHLPVWSNARNAVSDKFRQGKKQSSCHKPFSQISLTMLTLFLAGICGKKMTDSLIPQANASTLFINMKLLRILSCQKFTYLSAAKQTGIKSILDMAKVQINIVTIRRKPDLRQVRLLMFVWNSVLLLG